MLLSIDKEVKIKQKVKYSGPFFKDICDEIV